VFNLTDSAIVGGGIPGACESCGDLIGNGGDHYRALRPGCPSVVAARAQAELRASSASGRAYSALKLALVDDPQRDARSVHLGRTGSWQHA